MKVLHFIPTLLVGGAEKKLTALLTHSLTDQSEHVLCYQYPGPLLKEIQEAGIKTIKIPSTRNPFFLFKVIFSIIRVKPTVIHACLSPFTTFLRLLAPLMKTPVICDLHGATDILDARWFHKKLLAYTGHWADGYFPVSKLLRTLLVHSMNKGRELFERDKNNTDDYDERLLYFNVVDGGINPLDVNDSPHKRSDFGIPDDAFVVGWVGRLEEVKGCDQLLDMVGFLRYGLNGVRIKKLHIVIVGSGSQEDELKDMIKRQNLTNVTMVGFRDDAPKFYHLFDCFVSTCRSGWGMSLSSMYAFAAGIPVITAYPIPDHEFGNGPNLRPYDPETPITLAIALVEIYKDYEVNRKRVKDINTATAHIIFNERVMIRNYLRYFKLLSNEHEPDYLQYR